MSRVPTNMNQDNPSFPKRYVVIGVGGRATMFLDPLASRYQESAKLVGLCDTNARRIAWHNERLRREFNHPEVPGYSEADFDRMLAEQKPNFVIVCTVDASHHEYIIRALDAGCDVITEKPMTTDEAKCGQILDAVRRSGRRVRVTFNMRWMPGLTHIKKLILGGKIGRVKSVLLEYRLNTKHGADYFRRWHSDKSRSGGLLVHKSTHHFDLVNWWLDAIPKTVFAFGDLAFYGRANAVSRGREDLTRYDRYTGLAPDSDPFKLDLASNPNLKGLYLDAEKEDGYVRDRNVFRGGIDIEDTMSVLVKYRNGATLTYSLTAFCPSEGFRVSINGDGGRIEYTENFTSHIIGASAQESEEPPKLILHPLFQPAVEVDIPAGVGDHGGSDLLLQDQIFGTCPASDDRDAGPEQGAASALIGFAANNSLQTGQPVEINDLCPLRPMAAKLSELI